MYIRPHLDFCDVIYHIRKISDVSVPSFRLNNLMNSIEKIQYQAPRTHLYGNRSDNVLRGIFCRTNRYKKSFYPHSIQAWNDIGPDLRQEVSLSVFKTNILKLIRPLKNDTFGVYDPKGIKRLFQLRVGLSPLNGHKKRHNFRDTRSDVCSCLCASETTKHYLTRCTNERKILMDSISPTLMANHVPMVDNSSIVKCLLYGDVSLPPDVNSVILKATLKFMDDIERFV